MDEQTSPLGELLTVPELAEYLHISVSTVYRLIEKGQMPAFKVGRVWRFELEAIDDWIADRPPL